MKLHHPFPHTARLWRITKTDIVEKFQYIHSFSNTKNIKADNFDLCENEKWGIWDHKSSTTYLENEDKFKTFCY